MRRRICLVTTSRADFGLLSRLMQSISRDATLQLQVVVSGMHLMPRFGNTWKEIEEAGIRIDRKISMCVGGDSSLANLKAIGSGLRGFGDAFCSMKPHIVVLVGDRCEVLAPAIAALLLGIPIAHIHGGELSEGAIDDSVRHAITKMASIHFAATEVYRRRIVQMGESPRHVFNFGAPGLDLIHVAAPMSRSQLEGEIGFSLEPPIALVTYHPVTRHSGGTLADQMRNVIGAITGSGLRAIFTAANADPDGMQINRRFRELCRRAPRRFHWAPHLGHLRYLSCLAHCSVMIGNSSSGLIEAPSFHLPVVNIGDRQRGRVRALNVIDVPCKEKDILRAIHRARSPKFRLTLEGMENPYDRYRDGRASERIWKTLKKLPLEPELLKKEFYDIL